MIKALQTLPPIVFLIVATSMEVLGDALLRKALYGPHQIGARVGLAMVGGALLVGYGTTLNLAPIEFSRVAGLYIATLFVIWQVVNFIVFRGVPTLPILVGGALIVAGGLIVTFWRGGASAA